MPGHGAGRGVAPAGAPPAPATADPADHAAPPATLRRELGAWQLGAVAASMMLGTGIFFGPSLTAREFPDAVTVLGLWVVGGAVALAGAWTFGRLGALYPRSGGPYAYLMRAYRPGAAFLFAWTSFVLIAPTSSAAIAAVFAAHLSQVAPLSPPSLAVMGVWAVAGVALANGLGVKAGGRAQAALTGLKVVLVAALIALLLAAWGHPPPPAPPAAGGGRFSLAFVGILFAVGGWEYAVLASEEVRDPRRTIPRALLLGTALVVALYLLVVLAYLNVLGPDGVAHATALAPQAAAAALPGSEAFVAVAVAVSALGTLNAIMLLGPRATFAAARDGLVPAGAARLAGNGAPVLAILLQAALSCAFLLTGTFQAVAAYTVVGTGLFIVLCAAAVPRLRKRAGVVRRPVHALEDAAAFLVAGVFAWFLVDLAIEAPGTAGIGLALVAAGLVPMAVLRRRWRVPAQA